MLNRRCLAPSLLLALAALAGCSAAPSADGSRETSAAVEVVTVYPDADYEEGFDLDPVGAPTSGADANATSVLNDNDPQRPPNMPQNWLYVRDTCGPTSCSNMYDLYSSPNMVSPRYAFHNGCIASAGLLASIGLTENDFQGGAGYGDIESFLGKEIPGTHWSGEGTAADAGADSAGNAVASPEYSWAVMTALIDAHLPFVAGVSAEDPPDPDSVGHVLSVVDYKVREGGLEYVLIMNFGHYKWYPWLDKGEGASRLYGFHSRWSAADSGVKYYRIHADRPIADATWSSWHSP